MSASHLNPSHNLELNQDQAAASPPGVQLEIQRLYVKQQSAQAPNAPDIFQCKRKVNQKRWWR